MLAMLSVPPWRRRGSLVGGAGQDCDGTCWDQAPIRSPPVRPASRAVATEGTDSMASIAFDPADVIVGVDTHKDQHVAVALDGLGRRLGERFVSAAPAGYADLLAWAASLG